MNMTGHVYDIPESWRSLLGGRDASGWLTAFVESPKKAVDDLIWDSFYFGPLNLTERDQLLSGWLDLLGNSERFAERLDEQFASWVEENWGCFDRRAGSLVSAWSCLCSVVVSSAKLPEDHQLHECATVLRSRFAERQRFLGSFSTTPSADPLGLYLAVVAEFQGKDRTLAGFWHRLCALSDGVPFYHAPYALLGLRRLKAADPSEDGTLRAEVVLGLIRLARAFDRLVRERGLPENIARVAFRRVATRTAMAYPNSRRWAEHGLTEALQLPERAQKWLLAAVRPLTEAVQREKNRPEKHPYRYRSHHPTQPDPGWAQRAGDLATRIRNGDQNCLPEVELLLDEQRRYTESTGDPYFLVHSLCNFASRALHLLPERALPWAKEAREWEPHNPFTWMTIKDILLKQRKIEPALCFAWVAWKRFPEDVVARTGLAEVLKAAKRYQEAETVYRETIRRFPEDVVARNGLADTLRRSGYFEDAEEQYRQTIDSGIFDSVTLIALAHLVLRKGETGRVEALDLVNRTLALDPRNNYARRLKQKLESGSETDIADSANEWDRIADALFEEPALGESEEEDDAWADEQEDMQSIEEDRQQPSLRRTAIPEDGRSASSASGMGYQQPIKSSDLLIVAALVSEAFFYRTWAKDAEHQTAVARRQKTAELLARAEQLSPQDAQVLAEKIALSVDEGNESDAYQSLTAQLSSHPSATQLLVLKARLDRERARKENRPLKDSTFAELCDAPRRLGDLDPVLKPLSHFQKGLAALSLLDGATRLEIAADAFTSFRGILARWAAEERTGREKERDQRSKDTPRFHEWFHAQVNDRLFTGLSAQPDIQPDDIPVLESTWEQSHSPIQEVEDVFVDRFAFGII